MSDPKISSRPEMVRLTSLVLEGSPRQAGESEAHIRALAGVDGQLPPILVHRPSMRVLDGMHRVRAAMLRGDEAIRAVFFDGDEREAFVEAVRANISHGLPLTLADRKAAAQRLLSLYPEWSDRAVGSVTGLSAVTAQAIRSRATAGSGHLHARVGRDGKIRPLDSSRGRLRAAEVLAERPDASLRGVASRARVSVGTARDVRRRIAEGRDPVVSRRVLPRHLVAQETPRPGGATKADRRRGRRRTRRGRSPGSILADLERDPSLRYSEGGRTMIRWLHMRVVGVDDWATVAEAVPPHCTYAIAELASECARAWSEIADQLAARAEAGDGVPAAAGEERPSTDASSS